MVRNGKKLNGSECTKLTCRWVDISLNNMLFGLYRKWVGYQLCLVYFGLGRNGEPVYRW